MHSTKIFKNTLSALFKQFITLICGFIVPKLLIKTYGSDVNGLLSSITSFLTYITLLDAGFTAVIKSQLYKPIEEKNQEELIQILSGANKFFSSIAKIFIIYIIILLFVYPIITTNFSWKYTDLLIIIMSISTFAEYYFGITYRIFLQSAQKSYVVSMVYSITILLNTIAIVFLIKINANIFFVKFFSGVIFLIRPVFFNQYVKRKYNIKIEKNGDLKIIKNKWDGLAQHIASVIHNNTDIAILTLFSTLENVSIYSVYALVCSGVKNILSAITNGIDATFGSMIVKKEKERLLKNFNLYEIIYLNIATVIFTSAIILIVPFIKVYTNGIHDANYINYSFGYFLVISEYIWAIRLPYNSITLAAGHFKETKRGAWIECFLNIIISIVLVFNFNLVGVAIGTIVAMSVRTIEFLYHTNKYILETNMWNSIKKIILLVVETIIIVITSKFLITFTSNNYREWIVNAIIQIVYSSLLIIIFDLIFYKKNIREITYILKKNIKKFLKKINILRT